MQKQYGISITPEALSDLEGIFHFIERDSPRNAAGVIERIIKNIDRLYAMPSRFKIVGKSRKNGSPVHALVVRPYLVYYRVDETRRRVFILSVRHGARRPPDEFA